MPALISPPANSRARAAWALFDWAAQPWFTLVTTFIFAPYFAAALTGDPVRGQALWGYLQAGVAITVAFAAPWLGARMDRAGHLGPPVALASLAYVLGVAMLWFARPGEAGLILAMVAIFVAAIGVEFATIITNVLLPRLAGGNDVGRLSGSAWALGYAGGLISLGLVLALLAPVPGGERTLAGLIPLFGLDPGDGGPARATGPLSAIWYIVFVLPLFVFVPLKQKPAQGRPASVRDTIAILWSNRPLTRFLIARLFFQDALVAIFAFGGIYAAGLFGWTTFELGIFGILLAFAAGLGAWAGGFADDRLGPVPVIAGAILLAIAAIGLIATLGGEHARAGAVFASTAERLYLVAGIMLGIASGPMQAASRSLVARLAPVDHVGAAFGLLAFSGRATAFLGPLLVAVVTELAGSQRAGLVPIAALFGIGLVLLLFTVRINGGNGERR
ncbi:Uncharacterized MFS-type transporter [hydrothermal vent metagenome]|uniref:Uncharacterized MFS-type transporter n=1 Tax=hydrothermal vent metagenome TaxID=652676 RepID=A0A3B0U0J6_9ZZZZ